MSKAIELADEFRLTMPVEVVAEWGIKAAEELRRLAALEQAIKDAQPVAWAFQFEDGSWDRPSLTEHSLEMTPLYTMKGIK